MSAVVETGGGLELDLFTLAALGRLAGMGYDQELAERIRRLIGSDPDLTEKKMFGGLAFLIAGNMAIAASSQGDAMVRVDPDQSDTLVATTKASLVEMRSRPMPGWGRISPADLRTDGQLTPWVQEAPGTRAHYRPKLATNPGRFGRLCRSPCSVAAIRRKSTPDYRFN